jgi:N-acetylneuraminate synthase
MKNKKVKVIAEAGVNHEGSMELAKRLIHEAQEGGADAIKFQTYKAEKIAIRNSPSYWDLQKEATTSQFGLFKKYDKFWKKEYEELARVCESSGIEFMSTPFDPESASFLNDLVRTHKISSSDLNNIPFIKQISDFGKEIILSTGASELWEIQRAYSVIEKSNVPVCLLHCVLNYPTSNENANLSRITTLKSLFPNATIGYSDHTLPDDMSVLLIAALLGAEVIEKHFTHDKNLPGNDHYHSMDKRDLRLFLDKLEQATAILGSPVIHSLPSELVARQNARRSIVANRIIPRGKVIDENDLVAKRPGHGIGPDFTEIIIGRTASKTIQEDDVIDWSHLA